MSLILWMQLVVGLAVLTYGLVGPAATRRTFIMLGCLNAGNGGALLLFGQGNALGVVAFIAYGIFLAWVLRSISVKAWRDMPWLVATAAGTILCLTCLQLFHSAMPPAVRLFLLIMTGVFATAFVVYGLVSTSRLLAQSLARSSRTP